MGLQKLARPRYAIIAAIAVAIAIIAGTSAFALLSLNRAQQQPDFSLFPTHLPDLDTYANYPGAKITTRDPPSKYVLLYVEFRTVDKAEAVEAYYKDLAAKTGWKYMANDYMTDGPYYSYGGDGQQSLYGYEMRLKTASNADGTSQVLLRINRSLPIYPGAEQITLLDLPRTDLGGPMARFTTKDSPESVFALYERYIAQDGWTLLPRKDKDTIIFWLDNSSEHDAYGWAHNLGVTAKVDSTGETQVTVIDLQGMVQHP